MSLDRVPLVPPLLPADQTGRTGSTSAPRSAHSRRAGILIRVTPRPRRTSTHPVQSRRPDPLVWAQALKEANGDVRRLKLLEDGTVLVLRNSES